MTNELTVFENPEFGSVRTMEQDGEPWFVGKDVATILGYANASKAVLSHVDDEDKTFVMLDIADSQNGNVSVGQSKTALINESGLYSLILSSKLPTAKKFKRWVTSEVLPAIRRTGSYNTPQIPQGRELLALAVLEAQKTITEQSQQIMEMKPHAILGQAITSANTSILVGDMAKILRQNGIDMGGRRFFEWLRENGYLIKRKGADWNMPTQKSMEKGLFEIKESVHIDGNGCNVITKTPKISGKGQQYFVNKFLG